MKDMAKRVFYIGGLILLIVVVGGISFYLIAKKPVTSVPVSLPEEAARPEVTAPTPVTTPSTEAIPAPEVVEEVETAGWKEYEYKPYNIRFKYPPSAEVKVINGALVIGMFNLEGGGYDIATGYQMGIEAFSNPYQLSPRQWLDQELGDRRKQYEARGEEPPPFTIRKMEDITLSGLSALQYDVITDRVILVAGNKQIFNITYSRDPEGEALWPEIEKIIGLIIFK